MQSPQRQPLSDLEGAILGIVALSGPLTSYAVARVLAQSPSSRWSGSAGAVYPATGRLEERAFLAGSATEGRRRPRRTLTLTPAGETALAEWLAPPLPVAAVRATEDPIRTRVFFLGVLPPRARAEFIASAREMLARELATLG